MSQVNAMIEALEAVEAELKRLGSAIKAADPTTIRAAAAEGGKDAAAAPAQSVAAAAAQISAAAKDAAAAASAAKEAAAYSAAPSWMPGSAIAALLCLCLGVAGYFLGKREAQATAGLDAAWARQFNSVDREVVEIFVREVRRSTGWFATTTSVASDVATLTRSNLVPSDSQWLGPFFDRGMAEWSQRPEAKNARAFWRHNHANTCHQNSHRWEQNRPVCNISIWNDWQTRGY